MDKLNNVLRQMLGLLKDMNTQFPETQKFLLSKNKSHISDLTDDELNELEQHLFSTLMRLRCTGV